MTDELNERSQNILTAIIEDYIASAEPIGSRALARRHKLSLSPASVRNVMADLEDMGFLMAPHTSAGRVPTAHAYRFYVDSLLQVRQLTQAEKRRILTEFHRQGRNAKELFREAGRLLSKLSSYAGVVVAPQIEATVFQHIEFVPLTQGRILVIFVARSGLVQNHLIEVEQVPAPGELEQMSNYLNSTLAGLTIEEAKARIYQEMEQEKALYDRLLQQALQFSGAALSEQSESELYIEGTANILDQPEFADATRMRELFRAFDEKNRLLELLHKSQQAQGVQIFIGSNASAQPLDGCSLITATYSNDNRPLGTLGVIGPSRMPYSAVIPLVDYTAQLVSELLGEPDRDRGLFDDLGK